MATVSVVVLKHHRKKDKTWNVKIRVTKDSKSAYIDTIHFVVEKQLRKDYSIKDNFILDALAPILADYRRKISELGIKAELMDHKELAAYLEKKPEKNDVDFGKFCNEFIQGLKLEGRDGSAANLNTVYNALCDYFGHCDFMASEINYAMLVKFESFLKSPREMKRRLRGDKEIIIKSKPLSQAGIFNYFRDLRTMFNEARDLYNDEDKGVFKIPHYPFKKFKLKEAPISAKKALPIEIIKKIINCKVKPGSRMEMSRDLYSTSFYLCGMNAVDMFHFEKISNGRIEYKRSKTKGRRSDEAFISVKAVDEAMPNIYAYFGKLNKRYSTPNNLNKALSIGLSEIAEELNIPHFTFYSARHSFATIARNKCKCSKDDIAMAMNHVDQNLKTTDGYIETDWSIVDEVQSKVIEYLNKNVDNN